MTTETMHKIALRCPCGATMKVETDWFANLQAERKAFMEAHQSHLSLPRSE